MLDLANGVSNVYVMMGKYCATQLSQYNLHLAFPGQRRLGRHMAGRPNRRPHRQTNTFAVLTCWSDWRSSIAQRGHMRIHKNKARAPTSSRCACHVNLHKTRKRCAAPIIKGSRWSRDRFLCRLCRFRVVRISTYIYFYAYTCTAIKRNSVAVNLGSGIGIEHSGICGGGQTRIAFARYQLHYRVLPYHHTPHMLFFYVRFDEIISLGDIYNISLLNHTTATQIRFNEQANES